jgi:hypothetical protein
MSKVMYINAFYVSVGVLKVHMLSYVHAEASTKLAFEDFKILNWNEISPISYILFST